ncbi:MAG TPA: DMT family transporter [Geminicoccaceae bacterium]|jgi:drug/metabolite transporter (DMT)-like permease|nr:DMT family transporter [Geminicoccaceae bacterium]
MALTDTIQPKIEAASPAAASGLGLGALAFGLFSIMDALVKWLSATYPVPQLLVCNALFALLPVAIVVVRRGGLPQLRTRRLGLHLLRGVLGTTGGFLAFYAFSQLPLAEAYAIIFATPLLITALSVPILGEAVGWRRWCAVAVGFVGVLVMLRPGVAPVGAGSLSALGAACASACAILLVRKLSLTETTTSIAFYSNVVAVLLIGAIFGSAFVAPSPLDLALMAASGLIGGSALLVLIAAYRRTPAALVAPFQYTQMLWAIVLGALVWSDLPEPIMLVGALIVAASGLFILYRETTLGRRPTASLHPNAGTPKA